MDSDNSVDTICAFIDKIAPGLFPTWYNDTPRYGSLMLLMTEEIGDLLYRLDANQWNQVAAYWEDAVDGVAFAQYAVRMARESWEDATNER